MNAEKLEHYKYVLRGLLSLAAIGYGGWLIFDYEAATRPVKEGLTELFFKSSAVELPDCRKKAETGFKIDGTSYAISCIPK
ncbi:MAG TPA: hypothetical protein VIF12_01060 [Micavibrio sp.]